MHDQSVENYNAAAQVIATADVAHTIRYFGSVLNLWRPRDSVHHSRPRHRSRN
jgi:hypothetical protein